MVLVILQHAYLNVNIKLIPHLLDMLILSVTNLAAVAFVSISGTMFSYYLYTQSDWRAAYRRYAARAVFLLLVAHLGINLTSYFFRMVHNSNSPDSLSFVMRLILAFPITDTIAICLLVSPVFILRLRPTYRAVIIMIVLVTTPLIVASLSPADPYLVVLKEAIFGVNGEPAMFWFPLVPWLAIFLTGSLAGQALARFKQGRINASTLVRQMNKAGITLAICSVILTLGYKLLKIALIRDWSPALFTAIYPRQTTTLLPGYFALLAWLFASLMHRNEISGHYDRFMWFLSILGRTSLFTFVVQFAVIESGPAILGFTGSLGLQGFIVLFVLGLIVMLLFSYAYGRLRGWFRKSDYAECVNAARGHLSPS